jgi:hypothetical protein
LPIVVGATPTCSAIWWSLIAAPSAEPNLDDVLIDEEQLRIDDGGFVLRD